MPPSELRACSIDTVAVELAPTAAKQLLLRFVFPALYPAEPAVVELSSKALSSELIVKLGEAAGRLAAKHGGGRQVLHVVDWLRASLTTNRLAPAYDDLKALAKLFERHTSSRLVEANERTGEVQVRRGGGGLLATPAECA